MGLDQYLYASRYIHCSSYSSSDHQESALAMNVGSLIGVDVEDGMSVTVKVTVGYWRKANSIHKWFVDNIQGGNDDCGEYYVPREKLDELLDACNKVIADFNEWKLAPEDDVDRPSVPLVAEELLPPQSGFFFGSTAFDDNYLYDIEKTVKYIEYIKKNLPESKFSIYYSSSW